MLHWLECIECKTRFSADDVIYTCRNCGDLLDIIYDYDELRNSINYSALQKRPPSVWRYKELLPLREDISPISLGEGGTRIHHCKRLGKKLGMDKLYVKMEGDNPTGSFKDRGMTVGISKALECNMKTVICASTGNTSGSLAAYASKAGLRSIILIPAGKIAKGKLAQASIYGAEIFQIKGNFDNALQLVMDLTQSNDIYLLNSINPYRIEGQKTLAFESRDQIMKNPDWIVLPVGNAGNISAIWKGFLELKELAIENTIPRFAGIQAEGEP